MKARLALVALLLPSEALAALPRAGRAVPPSRAAAAVRLPALAPPSPAAGLASAAPQAHDPAGVVAAAADGPAPAAAGDGSGALGALQGAADGVAAARESGGSESGALDAAFTGAQGGRLVPYAPAADGAEAPRWFTLLPARARSVLARRSPALAAHQASALRREIGRLVDRDSFGFMAYLPQTSHDYLTLSLKPTPEGEKEAARALAKNPGWPDYMAAAAPRNAQQAAWFRRLAKARAKLLELAELDTSAPSAAVTQLALGVLHGFSYGFAGGLATGHHDGGHDSMSGGNRAFVDAATEHYRRALALLAGQPAGSTAVIMAKFLLGKHAINGAHAWSNPGLYRWSGEKVPAEPAAWESLALARSTLGEVLEALAPAAARGPFTGLHEIYFEARYALLEADKQEDRMRETRFSFDAGRDRSAAERRLLADLLLAAPPDWVMGQIRSRDRYSLLHRLVNDARWSRQAAGGGTETLYGLESEIRSGAAARLTYEALIHALVSDGFPELSVLVDGSRLPGR